MDKLAKVKSLFFDRKRVQDALDKNTRNVLSRFGALVRQTSRWSIRKRKRSSLPGQPPSSHTGLLKRFIFYSYDEFQKSVIIGPAKLNDKNTGAPEILEYGGRTVIESRKRKEKVYIQPRPYMHPAFSKAMVQLPYLWRNRLT